MVQLQGHTVIGTRLMRYDSPPPPPYIRRGEPTTQWSAVHCSTPWSRQPAKISFMELYLHHLWIYPLYIMYSRRDIYTYYTHAHSSLTWISLDCVECESNPLYIYCTCHQKEWRKDGTMPLERWMHQTWVVPSGLSGKTIWIVWEKRTCARLLSSILNIQWVSATYHFFLNIIKSY